MKPAQRIQAIEEYYFSKKLREVNLLKASGLPVINLGIGSPDLAPPQRVVDALVTALNDPTAHKYQSYQGLLELREAMAQFYRDHYQVYLSAKTEILPLMGSKEGIMHISMAFLEKGDEVLIPNPGYPAYSAVTKLVRATPVYYDLNSENKWQPDVLELEQRDLSRVKMMWINYPHMPTGTQADFRVFQDLVEFAKRNNILLVNDNPYSFVLNESPRSLLSIQGSKAHCLELNSLSKTFNMAGWRVGMVVGDEAHINAILKVKSNMDSGMFYGLQKGAIEALKCSSMWYHSLNNVYSERRALIWKLADALNCKYDRQSVGMFVWARLPEFFSSDEFINIISKLFF